MARLVIFPKTFRGNFKVREFLVLAAIFWLSSWLFVPASAWAYPFFRSSFPPGYTPKRDFTAGTAAAGSCTAGEGRVFSFNYQFPFNLEGVSFYILTPAAKAQSFEAKTFLFSLYPDEGDDLKSLTPYAFRVPASFKSLVAYDSQNNPTYEVFFPIEPVFVEPSKNYRGLLECLVKTKDLYRFWETAKTTTGLIRGYFDSDKFTEKSYPSSVTKLQFSLYYKNASPQDKPIRAVKSSPATRPAIFVHGLGGRPEDFSDYLDLLKSQGWPDRYLLSFDFGLKGDSLEYDNFADLYRLASRLNLAVATMSAQHRLDGGDGQVDLVSFSSGSLVAKNYLGLYKESHNVRRLISIAGLFKGSFLVDLEGGRENFPGAQTLPLRLVKSFLDSIKQLNPLTSGRVPPNPEFKGQIAWGSSPVTSFKKEDLPSDVSYLSLQGDLKLKSTQKIFASAVSRQDSLGDGAVLTESSADLPNVSVFPLLEYLVSTRNTVRASATVSASFTLPEFSKLKFFHGQLLRAVEVRNKVGELLR